MTVNSERQRVLVRNGKLNHATFYFIARPPITFKLNRKWKRLYASRWKRVPQAILALCHHKIRFTFQKVSRKAGVRKILGTGFCPVAQTIFIQFGEGACWKLNELYSSSKLTEFIVNWLTQDSFGYLHWLTGKNKLQRLPKFPLMPGHPYRHITWRKDLSLRFPACLPV